MSGFLDNDNYGFCRHLDSLVISLLGTDKISLKEAIAITNRIIVPLSGQRDINCLNEIVAKSRLETKENLIRVINQLFFAIDRSGFPSQKKFSKKRYY